jgi:uncharacterized protein (TIGR00725 family)
VAGCYVAVVGPGVAEAPELDAAREVGGRLAAAGAVLVCGGLGGVMDAACAGARDAGGITVGLLPGLDRSEANAHLSVAIPTGLGELRNGLVVRAADAVIAVGGSLGTLSELALAARTGVAVVLLNSWSVTDADGLEHALGARVRSPAEAVELALRAARS